MMSIIGIVQLYLIEVVYKIDVNFRIYMGHHNLFKIQNTSYNLQVESKILDKTLIFHCV